MASSGSMTTHLLRPSKPFEYTTPLSIIDVVNPPINSRNLFIWKNPENASSGWQDDLVDRLCKSLETFLREPEEGILAVPKLLATLYSDPNNGRLTAKVTKDSAIRFVVRHEPGFNYSDLQPEHNFPTRCLDPKIFSTISEGLPTKKADGGFEGFCFQLTFINGGFVFLFSKHHWLVDGMAIGRLLKWWFARARTLMTEKSAVGPEYVDPAFAKGVLDGSSLMKEDKVEPKEHIEWKVVPNVGTTVFGTILPHPFIMYLVSFIRPLIKPRVDSRVFHFSIASLKALNASIAQYTTERFSTHDAVCALAWRCITRARYFTARNTLKLPEHVMFSLSVNVRTKLNPPLSPDYLGNAAVFGAVKLPAATLTEDSEISLGEVALEIRNAIQNKATDAYVRSLTQLAASQPRVTDVINNFRAYRGYDTVVTSWMSLFGSVEDMDVGVGKYMRMRTPGGASFDGVGIVMPAYGQREVVRQGEPGEYPGGLEISLDLLAKDMEFLMKDPEWTKFARNSEA